MQMARIGSTGRSCQATGIDLNICGIISRNHTMCHILAGTVCLEIIFYVFDCIQSNTFCAFGTFNIKQSQLSKSVSFIAKYKQCVFQ